MMANLNCLCCQNPREDFWHCKDCWDKYHNGERDNDWLDLDEYRKRFGEK